LRYPVAILTVLSAFLATYHIPELRVSPSTLFIAAVMVSAWHGGLGPGMLATVLSGLIIDYWFVLPNYAPGKEFADLVRWGEFMLVAFLISSLNAKRKQIEEILRQAHQDAETLVQVRTAELAWANESLVAENSERRRAEEMLTLTQKRLQYLLAKSPVLLYALKVEENRTTPTWFSDNFVRITGHDAEKALLPSWWADHIHPQDRKRIGSGLEHPNGREQWSQEYRFRHRNGTYRWIRDERRWISDGERGGVSAPNGERGNFSAPNGERGGVSAPSGEIVGSWTDITESKHAEETLQKTEEQLRQAQKMEAIGRLAGGVAHDFNNLLMVINGNCELALTGLAPEDPTRNLVEEIKQSGDKAALLTRQLVAFGRKQMLTPMLLDLNDLTANMDKMLRRLIGEDIELVTRLDPKIAAVKADPGQIEQILMNLAVNARDAMPEGGRLTLQTQNVDLDEEFAQDHAEASPGSYVKLVVTDTGCGMDAETQAHIFEPFFTTKDIGKGTGLGLATVYGIVKQSGGFILTTSAVGRGTTFVIYLPAMSLRAWPQACSAEEDSFVNGEETVLLVEDEDEVRDVLQQCLANHGYKVLTAPSGVEAVRLAEEYTDPIHLLVTDVVMPRMGGRELADLLIAGRPDLRVLFISGYTEDAVMRHGVHEAEMAFLQKPFALTSFGQKVREVLDQTTCVA
jgi:signal transduction histidine kinase/ActR/RegA family two-component response regulator